MQTAPDKDIPVIFEDEHGQLDVGELAGGLAVGLAGGLADDRPGVLGGGPLGSKADLASGLAKGLAMPEKFASLAEMEDWVEMIKARVIGGGDIRISGGDSGNTDTLV